MTLGDIVVDAANALHEGREGEALVAIDKLLAQWDAELPEMRISEKMKLLEDVRGLAIAMFYKGYQLGKPAGWPEGNDE